MTTLRVDTLLSMDGTVERVIADLPDRTAYEARFTDIEGKLPSKMEYASSEADLLSKDRVDFVDGQHFSVEGEGLYTYDLTGDSFTKYTGEAALLDLSSNGGSVYEIEHNSVTVNIPSDYVTEADAIEEFSSIATPPGVTITLNLQSTYQPTQPILLENGDYSRFRIVAEDATVFASSGWSLNSYYLSGNNAKLPVLACKLDMAGRGNGVSVRKNSNIYIETGAGAVNTYSTGLSVQEGSSASARGTVWTEAGQVGTTGSGITVWGSYADCEEADVSNSEYYGAQVSHGGVLNFRFGIANSCTRYNIRATDGGLLDFDSGTANSAGLIGIYAFNGSTINARSCTANNNGQGGTGGNVVSSAGSSINAVDGNFDGGADYSALAQTGSHIALNNAYAQRLGSAGSTDIQVSSGSTISASGSTGGTNVTINTLSSDGIIFK